ncbi:MAG TPA: lysozyme [Crinalium sp.]|jgi:GH24 family phage-related lysozyme (muramidase)
MAYSVKFVLDTWLKQSTADSSQLSDDQLQYIDAGTELPIIGVQPVDNNHIKITFGQDAQGNQIFFKGKNTWYAYGPGVQLLRDGELVTADNPDSQPDTDAPVYVIKAVLDTWLKQSTIQGSQLPDDQRQFLDAGTVLPISSYAILDDHLKITLGKDDEGKQVFFKGLTTWYVYRSDVQILRDGKVIITGTEPDVSPTPLYVLKAVLDTWLKRSTAQGSTLPDSQRQLLNAGTVLPISSYALIEPDHLQIALGKDSDGNQIFFKGLTTWYVYRSDVQILRDGKVIIFGSDSDTDADTTPEGRHINSRGLQLLKSFEGLSLTAYRDVVGVWTIGYGTTAGVKPGMKITQKQAEALLRRDLQRFERAVSNLVKVPLTDNQFAALVSFTYNVGERALATSSLLRVLNQRNYRGAADQFLRWNRAGGRAIAGLTRRRQAERSLFLS